MALQVKEKLTPSYNWKSILLEDTTGTGITGYGSNQTPQTYRETTTSSTYCRVTLTSPSEEVYGPVTLNHSAFLTLLSDGLTLDYLFDSGILGLTEDDYLEDGLWKIDYDVVFENDYSTQISASSNKINFTFDSVSKPYFINNSYFVIGSTFYKIATLNLNTLSGTVSTELPVTGANLIDYSAYTSSFYTPIAKSIKECLDNKVADLSICDCGCLEQQTVKLINMYLLYDAMFDNCVANNPTKAQQIFDLLTTYCEQDCGCNS